MSVRRNSCISSISLSRIFWQSKNFWRIEIYSFLFSAIGLMATFMNSLPEGNEVRWSDFDPQAVIDEVHTALGLGSHYTFFQRVKKIIDYFDRYSYFGCQSHDPGTGCGCKTRIRGKLFWLPHITLPQNNSYFKWWSCLLHSVKRVINEKLDFCAIGVLLVR